MAFKKRRLIQAISDRCPKDATSLLEATKKEIWPFLQQVRRLLLDATGGGDVPGGTGTGGTTVVVNEGDTNTTVISTTINPSPFSDHLVKARTLDETSVGGLSEKTKAGNRISLSVTNDAGVEKLLIGAIDQPASVSGAYLRLAGVMDPHLRAPVRCLAASGSGGGMGSGSGGGMMLGLVFDWWYQIAGSAGTWTWRSKNNGILLGYSSSGTIACVKGDRILVDRELKYVLDIGYSYVSVPSPYIGIYEVLDPGTADTPAVIRRSSDANTASEFYIGTIVQVTGEPKSDQYGKYYRFDAAGTISPDLTNVVADQYAYVAPNQQQLLTDAEYRLASLEPSPLYVEWEVVDGEAWPESNYFDTTATIPGASAIAAGTQRFYGPAFWVEGANPGVNPGDTFVGYRIIKLPTGGGDPVTLFDAYDSAPITNSVGASRNWQVDILTTSLSPTDRLRLIPIAKTTCKSAVTVHMEWHQPTDSPYWLTTMQFPALGSDDHSALSNRGIRGQHPTLAIDPSPQEFVTVTAGVMPAVTYGSWANVTASSDNLDAMDAAGFPDYGEREVYCSVGFKLRSDQPATGTNRPIRTYKSTFASYQTLNARAGATVRFRYRPDLGASGMWLLTGVQQG